jgi:uncharacterized membrane protein
LEETFAAVARAVALGIEVAAVLLIAAGSLQALVRIAMSAPRALPSGWRRHIWVDFGVWLMLGLEFMLAADVIRSAIAPTWRNIGELAAIAVIRTFLNYFLEKDIEAFLSSMSLEGTAR